MTVLWRIPPRDGKIKYFATFVNDPDHPIPADEIEDVTRELVNAGEWVSVATPEEADFILKMESKKKMVFNSPRTWLTPYVLDKIEDYESRPQAYAEDNFRHLFRQRFGLTPSKFRG